MGFFKLKLNFQLSTLDAPVTHGGNFKITKKITSPKITIYHVQPCKLLVNIVNYGKQW